MRLTEAGTLFRKRTAYILELVDNTINEISDLNLGISGTLILGTITTSGAALLPSLIREFRNQFPNVAFQLYEGDGNRVIELLEKGVTEIGILRLPFDPDIFDAVRFPEEPLVVAMNRNVYRYGDNNESVRLQELIDAPMILPYRWETMFKEHCKKAGFEPKVACRSDGITHDLLWADAGIAIALIPQSASVLFPSSTLVFKPIIEPSLFTQTAVIWLKNHILSTTARHFLALVKEKAASEKVLTPDLSKKT